MAIPTPHDCLRDAIMRWEGEWQADSNDSGNYAHCHDGTTKLIGTMRGVTPDVYADFSGIDPCTLTPAAMQAAIDANTAADIGVKLFYNGPRFDRLTWSPLVEIALDIGWGSGPGRAIKMLQSQIGTVPDGGIGPQTAAALDSYLEAHDIGAACEQLSDARAQFYVSISMPGSKNARFRAGWLKRANWYRTSNEQWWSQRKDWVMPIPAGSSKPVGLIS